MDRYKLLKASNDAGLRLHQYAKYLLLLKGSYDTAPAAMSAAVQETCGITGDFYCNGCCAAMILTWSTSLAVGRLHTKSIWEG